FFQAEDGIRDFHVTGVQTCALPILAGWEAISRRHQDQAVLFELADEEDDLQVMEEVGRELAGLEKEVESLELASLLNGEYDSHRSEERRVGKECRERWATENEREKG